MTRLDQLIQRIEDPIKVSTEDAMDVVKQYWDEAANTVSTYWNDTDTEVAEEIGIPKPTLSQLLDQHGNGTAYANRGGNSGVDSYVTGENWILVNFTTGAKYLYTHKSTTYENIEQMKRYAEEGRGLNSFIMRISKDGYAGRNIKGTILVRPGMEHYRQQANKRLQLLYAFRNAKMSTVSNVASSENISSAIGNEIRMHNTINTYQTQLAKAGADGLDSTARQFMAVGLESMQPIAAEPMYQPGTDVASLEGIWDSIKDFFAGRPTKIHLAGGDRGLRAKLDRTINDRTWLSRQKYTLGEVNYRALPDFSVATARKYVQDYKMAVNSTSQHNTREMAKIRERLAAVPRVISMYAYREMKDTALIEAAIADINPYLVRLNINIQEPPLMSTEMSTQTGQALTKVEVKDFAELVAQVHATQSAYENSIWVDPNVPSMASIQFRYGQKPDGQAIIAACRRAVAAYQNVVLMVNREIKQRVTTHAAWINAENIADSLVNYIGKSLTNITTNSFESFNAPIVPSNEDLLGAVKKFFTPSKDKGIYDTVNKGFLQDLSKEVKKYADPSWVKTHGSNEAKTIEVDGANLIDSYDQVVSDFITECKANRAKQHEACEMAFKNMDEVIAMIDRKQLGSSDNVHKAITILKTTRQIKAPHVEVPKVKTEVGAVKTLTPQEITEKATKLLELFNTLGADTTYVDRWNKNYRNSPAWMDWKYVGKANYKELYDQVKDPKFTDLYQKAMEHVYDMTYIGAEFHKLKPYVMAVFQLIEKSVKDS